MKNRLNPLLFIRDKQVVVIEDNSIPAPGAVNYRKMTDSYQIRINTNLSFDLYTKSFLKKVIPYEDLLLGITCHEVFHIEYDSFTIDQHIPSEFFRYILNILLDSQIEYNAAKDHPDAAKYIRYLLIGLRRDADMSSLRYITGGDKMILMKEALYFLTRFGIQKEAPDGFYDFVLPIVLSTTRNLVENVNLGAIAIYNYFLASAETQDVLDAIETIQCVYVPVSTGEAEKIAQSDTTITDSSSKDEVEDMLQQKSNNIGTEGVKIEIHEDDDSFYQFVVANNQDKIDLIRQALLRKFSEIELCVAKEGDFNLKRQQQAYINSFLAEDEGYDYIVPRKRIVSIDHVLLRDTSGSTYHIEKEYAIFSVILHAAMQEIRGLRDAHVDFNSYSETLLEFDQNLRKARIRPVSNGGTSITSALEKVLAMQWKALHQVVNIVTDGQISSGYEELEQKLLNQGKRIWKWDIGGTNEPHIRKSSPETFHIDIARAILYEL